MKKDNNLPPCLEKKPKKLLSPTKKVLSRAFSILKVTFIHGERAVKITKRFADMQPEIETEAPQRSLPEGKMYHVFISYRDSDEDRGWVRQLISSLQNRYHFICCDHAIDFEPGKKIIDNIKEAITKSSKTIVILSKEYKESYWCQFEIEYALLWNMDINEHFLIPVLKEDCEIPDYLRPFTYIDARESDMDQWLPKLVSAIESKEQTFNHRILTERQTLETGIGNLEILHQEKARCNCGGPVFNTRYVPHSLHRVGTPLYSSIMKKISSSYSVKGRHCRNIWLPTLVNFIVFGLLIGALGIFMLVADPSYTNYFADTIHVVGLVFTVIVAMMVFVWLPICFCTDRQCQKQLRSICMENNQMLIVHNIMMTVSYVRLKAEVTVLFVYYNCQPCLDYIKNALDVSINANNPYEMTSIGDEDNAPLITLEQNATRNANDIMEEAQNILLKLSVPYLQDFTSSKLDTAINVRHTTRAMCICQYAEAKGIIRKIIQV